jgi:hypothetical protein
MRKISAVPTQQKLEAKNEAQKDEKKAAGL